MRYVKQIFVPEEYKELQTSILTKLREGSSKNLEDLVDAQAIEDAMVSIGELGWVDPDETPPEVKRALDTARDGDAPVACPTPVGLLVMQVTESRERTEIRQIQAQDFASHLAESDLGQPLQLVDVREEWEAAAASIPGFKLLPLSRAAEWEDDLVEIFDTSRPIYCLCHHGVRSQRMAHLLQAKGFRNVYNIVGGIDAYSKEVDPSVPVY